MSEQLKILEMVEKGQISASEGMDLLEALNLSRVEENIPLQTSPVKFRNNYKFLKVRVTSNDQSVNVNVNVPLRLLTTIGEIADKMTSFVPADARREIEAKGIDITNINYASIIEEIINGTLDDPNIVEVEAWDEGHKAMIKVHVYVD